MAHEVTKTFKIDDKWVVAPSMYKGEELSEEQLADKVRAGEIKALKRFDSLDKANDYAEARSKLGRGGVKSVLGRVRQGK